MPWEGEAHVLTMIIMWIRVPNSAAVAEAQRGRVLSRDGPVKGVESHLSEVFQSAGGHVSLLSRPAGNGPETQTATVCDGVIPLSVSVCRPRAVCDGLFKSMPSRTPSPAPSIGPRGWGRLRGGPEPQF